MFVYDFNTRVWDYKEQHGAIPSPRSCPSWIVRDKKIYMFGGNYGVNLFGDLHEFDIDITLHPRWADNIERPAII